MTVQNFIKIVSTVFEKFEMLEFKNVSKSNENLIQFLQKTLIRCDFYKCKSWNFSELIFRVFSEEILNLNR